MKDLLQELVLARNKKIYKDNDFKTLLSILKGLNINNKINSQNNNNDVVLPNINSQRYLYKK